MKLILQILLILLIISTFSVCAIKPNLHKNVIVYDSNYTLVTEEEVKTETKSIPVMEMPLAPVQKTTIAEKNVKPDIQTKKTQTTNIKKQTQTIPKQNTTVQKTVTQPQVQTKTKKTTIGTKPIVKDTKTEIPRIEQRTTVKTVEQPKVLTQQEENIAWNIWRSNLTNKIMQDTKLPDIPNGTLFQFSFTVDKYGKILNVQTGANPANYTPYAIQYIAPVIRSYQGHSILNFPEGTARISTQVTGKWRISNTEKYSTPQDYNDIEKIRKY